MSDTDPLDLNPKDLMASWVSDLEKPSTDTTKKYDFPDEFDDSKKGRKGSRGKFGGREGGGRGFGGRNDRDGRGGGGGRPGGRRDDRGGGGGRDGRGGRDQRDGRGGRGGGKGGFRGGRDRNFDDRPKEPPLPKVSAQVRPTKDAVDALAKHIRSTGRAYVMADVAKMVLASRDRYEVHFGPFKPKRQAKKKGAAGKAQEPPKKQPVKHFDPVPLFQVKADGSLWLSREEAIGHILHSDAISSFYDVEEIAVDPPSGNYTQVAVCGFSGHIFGPSSHHEYQRNVQRHHAERFSNMSLDRYKSRIEMSREEEVIEKWKEQVSTKLRYAVKLEETPKPAVEVEAPEEVAATAEAETPPADELGEETVANAAAEEAPSEPVAEVEPEAGEEAPAEESAAESEPTEESAEPEAEAAPESAEPEATEPEASEPEPSEEPAIEREYLADSDAVGHHFRKHFADKAVVERKKASVSGDIPARHLSRGLFSVLRNETDALRKGFPLPLIQTLCYEFERRGLKFFKYGGKKLYISAVRPRGIEDVNALSERIQQIVEYIRRKPRISVIELLKALVPDFVAPEKPAPPAEGEEPLTPIPHQPTQAEIAVLTDLRWLMSEGFVIEFPNGRLGLGRLDAPNQPPPAPSKPKRKSAKKAAAKAPKEEKAEAKSEAPEETKEAPADDTATEAGAAIKLPAAEQSEAEASVTEVPTAASAEPEAPAEPVEVPVAEEIKEPVPETATSPIEDATGEEQEEP